MSATNAARRSTAMTSQAHALPPEILERIFLLVSPDATSLDLESCSLVCSAWTPSAQRLILSKIGVMSTLHGRDNIESIPPIAHHVQVLTIGGFPARAPHSSILRMASFFSGLRVLHLRFTNTPAEVTPWAAFSHLTALSLTECSFEDHSAMLEALSAFHALKELVLMRVAVNVAHVADKSELKSLRLTTFKSDVSHTMRVLPWLSNPPELERLAAHAAGPTYIPIRDAVSANASTLRELYLAVSPFKSDTPGAADLTARGARLFSPAQRAVFLSCSLQRRRL
jgi:hypothetical protein